MLRTIRKTVIYPYPRDMLWRALTDAGALAAWLMPNDFHPEIGHAFTFRTEPAPGFDGIVRCRVLDLRKPELWRISWTAGRLQTELTIRLQAVPEGTRLELEQSGFALPDILPRLILGAGWGRLLKQKLRAVLEQTS